MKLKKIKEEKSKKKKKKHYSNEYCFVRKGTVKAPLLVFFLILGYFSHYTEALTNLFIFNIEE
jgi:hypothetical protein